VIVTAAEDKEMLQLPSNLIHYGTRILVRFAQEIGQHTRDLQLLFNEIAELNGRFLIQRDGTRSTVLMWLTAGKGCLALLVAMSFEPRKFVGILPMVLAKMGTGKSEEMSED